MFVYTINDIIGLAFLGIVGVCLVLMGAFLATDWAMRKVKGWFK